jgi:hypothetical protein
VDDPDRCLVAIRQGHSVFQHVGFVLGLRAAGLPVGAGPILGRPGTARRSSVVPAPATAADNVRAAQDDDPSVAGGLLQVEIDVWAVRMTS